MCFSSSSAAILVKINGLKPRYEKLVLHPGPSETPRGVGIIRKGESGPFPQGRDHKGEDDSCPQVKPQHLCRPLVAGWSVSFEMQQTFYELWIMGQRAKGKTAPKKYNVAPDITRRGATDTPIISII